MMKRTLCLIFLFVALKFQAQPPSKWYNKFGGFGIDMGYAVEESFNRQYIVCGSTSSYGYGLHDAILILVDSMGQKIWEKNYGGALTDIAKNIIFNPSDSGYIFTGYTNSMGNGGYDLYIVRTNKNGNIIWEKTFGGFDWDFGNDLSYSSDGNIVVCGNTYNSKYGNSDAYVLKLSLLNGNLIWEKKFGGAEDDDLRALKLTTDGHFVLTGKTQSYTDQKGDIYLFKINQNGDSILCKTFGLQNKIDYGVDIIVDDFNDYLIAGGSESYTNGMLDAVLLKSTSTGSLVWVSNFGKPDLDEEMSRICLTKNYQGMYAITYSTIEFATFKKDPKVIALDVNGFYIFATGFGQSEDEELFGMANTSDKGYICAGYTKSYNSNLEDVFVVKFDSVFTFNGNVIGLKENKPLSHAIKAYPSVLNESSSILTFENTGTKNTFFTVYDIQGNITNSYNFEPDQKLKQIDFKGFKTGIYLIYFKFDEQYGSFKVIKTD